MSSVSEAVDVVEGATINGVVLSSGWNEDTQEYLPPSEGSR